MDAAWVAVGVSVVSLLLGPVMSYLAARRGTEVALAVQQERHSALASRVEEDRALARQAKEIHDKRLAAHELEIGLLKRGSFGDRVPDYPVGG
jgi:hypothetical protein